MVKLHLLAVGSTTAFLFVLALQGQTSQPSHPSPSLRNGTTQQNPSSNKFKEYPYNQQRGSESFPFIVQVKTQPTSGIETAAIQKQKDNDAATKWWGIIMGLVGLVIAGGQTYIFRRQLEVFSNQKALMQTQAMIMDSALEATKDSVIEAKRGTDVAINAERAWVIDEIRPMVEFPKEDEILRVYLTFKNWGQIPATISDLKVRFRTCRIPETDSLVGGELLSVEPTYDNTQFFLELGEKGCILAPNQSLTVPYTFEEEGGRLPSFLRILMPRLRRLVCYGKISYSDGYGTYRINQFCYIWDPGYDPQGVIPNFRRIGPLNYNHAD